MTKEELDRHLASVAGGPRTEEDIAKAERKYREKILQGQAEIAIAKMDARRPPGAAPLSNLAGLRASMPGFAHDIASLPEVEDAPEVVQVANGKADRPPDFEMIKALGNLWVETRKASGGAKAWEEFNEHVMRNLHRLVPGFGTLKDVVGMVKGLDEYANPVNPVSSKKKNSVEAYKKALLADESEE